MKAQPLFRFIHCADLHLDSPFRGIRNLDPDIAGVLQEATFKSFNNIVNFAISSHSDFLVIAGDVYNQADRSLRAQLKFREMLQKTAAQNIQCYICHGNHDPLSGWEAGINFPENVHRFNKGGVERVTVRRGDEGLADIYGISYPEREVNQNLSLGFKKEPGSLFSIGVLHCNVGGDKSHDNYSPCTVDDLVGTGMDYWALGHIHATRVVRQKNPCIYYSGCIQGLDILEGGSHGCYLVSVQADGEIDTQFQETDEVRWFIKEVDIADLNTLDQLLDVLSRICQETGSSADGRLALLRFHLVGRGTLHNQLQDHIDIEQDIVSPLRHNSTGSLMAWVESVQLDTRPVIDLASRRKADNSVGDFLRASESWRNQDNSDELTRELLRQNAPKLLADQIDKLSASDLAEIRDAAEWLGLEKLVPEE
jgi:exonuclease SbcD